MRQSIISRVKALEWSFSRPVEVWNMYIMPDGRQVKTNDQAEGSRLLSQGAKWDLLVSVHDDRSMIL